jgi:hypothetical protein
MVEVNSKNPTIERELNLDTTTAMWQTVYREELNSYAFQLFDLRDRPGVPKDILVRLMTFICDLINGIKVPTEEYNRRLEALDVGNMEKQFAAKIQAVYQKRNQ